MALLGVQDLLPMVVIDSNAPSDPNTSNRMLCPVVGKPIGSM
jgi:hypothetical protein